MEGADDGLQVVVYLAHVLLKAEEEVLFTH